MPLTLSQPVATLTMPADHVARRLPGAVGLSLAALVSGAGWALVVLGARIIL